MKRFVVLLLLSLSLGLTVGCTNTPSEGMNAPLKTEGTVATPPGCEDLRERGGAC